MSYSQNNEEEAIVQCLKGKIGALLDIGAYSPEAFSNSRALLDSGWAGVLVEPSPGPFQALLKHFGDNPRIELINSVIVAEASGLVPFYDSNGDAISTTDEDHRSKWEAGWKVKYSKFWVQPLSLYTLFDAFGYAFNFINIDTEATSAALALRLPLVSLGALQCVCIEHDSRIAEINDHYRAFGFKEILQNGENIILAR